TAIQFNRSCGINNLKYPFGFSADSQIKLTCSPTGEIFIGEFPVQSVNPDSIKINIEAKCNRSIQTIHQLYGQNYAPTSRNAILLQNCSLPKPCKLPSIKVQTQFQSVNCSSKSSNMSCYAELGTKENSFLDINKVIQSQCKYLLSAISTASFNDSGVLEVQVFELGWWLDGGCHCSTNANCTKFNSPAGPGFRCQCKDGFEGDGYLNGLGCRKDCNLEKSMSGECGGTTRMAVLVGVIVAGTSIIISSGLICCFINRRTSSSKSRKSAKHQLLYRAKDISIPIYPYKEIEKATHSFSEKQRLGTGAFGTVYAGKLHNDLWVAIKRIKHRDTDSIEQVMNEIKLLSSVSHPNLVRLLGCSIENGEQILVYEFMPNGTLCQHLQGERGDGLSWPVRLTIACETAQAISHLHSAINPPIYHRDIKSSNILLDYNFRSKVADFGLSRLGMTEMSHISTAPQGTPGYLDPQYYQNFQLSDKSDVYSFGVVLVEIITAMKVVDFTRIQNEVNLANLATDRIGKACLHEIIDPFLEPHTDAWTLSSVHKVAELAFRCLAFNREIRPSMIEVAAELEQVRLSRWVPSGETTNCTASLELSSHNSSCNKSEKPLSLTVKKSGLEGKGLSMLQTGDSIVNSMDKVCYNSPVSVQDPWLSEQSSPSSNSLLNNVL
ncbi:Pkinase domain-containing protein, partial [Cephalotus follicularis]